MTDHSNQQHHYTHQQTSTVKSGKCETSNMYVVHHSVKQLELGETSNKLVTHHGGNHRLVSGQQISAVHLNQVQLSTQYMTEHSDQQQIDPEQ